MLRRQLPVHSPLAARDILRAAKLARQEPQAVRRELSRLLREHFRADDVLLLGSGTQALQVAIECAAQHASKRSGMRVALPAYSCYDVATAALGAEVSMVFYDLDPDTLGPDFESFEEALSGGAQAAVVAPLYGFPVDWAAVKAIADQHDVVLIEDAAQAAGAHWKGHPVGSFGTYSVVSFGRGKGWTGGEGGALLGRGTSRPGSIFSHDLQNALRDSAAHQRLAPLVTSAAQWLLGRPSLYWIPTSLPWLRLGDTYFREPQMLKSMSATGAALALQTHKRLAREEETRRSHGRWYLERMSSELHQFLRPVRPLTGGKPGWLRFPVRVGNSLSTSEWSKLQRLGVTSGYPQIIPGLSEVRRHIVEPPSTFPGASELTANLVSAPTHSHVTSRDLEMILQILSS